MQKYFDKTKAFRSRLIDYLIYLTMEGLDHADDATKASARAAYAETFNGFTLNKFPATQRERLEDGTEIVHVKFELVKKTEVK